MSVLLNTVIKVHLNLKHHVSFPSVDSRRHNDDLDEADEEKDEGGAGHVSPKPGVHLFGVLREGEETETEGQQSAPALLIVCPPDSKLHQLAKTVT